MMFFYFFYFLFNYIFNQSKSRQEKTTCELLANLTLSRLVLEGRCPRLLASMGCQPATLLMETVLKASSFQLNSTFFPWDLRGHTLKNSISLHHMTFGLKRL